MKLEEAWVELGLPQDSLIKLKETQPMPIESAWETLGFAPKFLAPLLYKMSKKKYHKEYDLINNPLLWD